MLNNSIAAPVSGHVTGAQIRIVSVVVLGAFLALLNQTVMPQLYGGAAEHSGSACLLKGGRGVVGGTAGASLRADAGRTENGESVRLSLFGRGRAAALSLLLEPAADEEGAADSAAAL